jgi:hypothetical protein
MAIKDVLNVPKGAENKAGGLIPEKTPDATTSENRPEQVILAQSRDDLFLRQLMEESKNEPEAWAADTVTIDEQFKSMFQLPEALRKGPKQAPQAKERSYCWVEVTDERVARTYVRDGWIPVNRTNHEFLSSSLFSIHGGVERNGYSRHILFYQPKKYNEAKKMAAVKMAQDRLEDNKKKLENSDGPIRLEEVTTSGGYGVTPGDDPIETDWGGNRVEASPAD